MMATPTFKMFGLTMILASLTVLVAAGNEINGTSTASPVKVQKMPVAVMTKINATTVVEDTPPLAAVMDLFQAPLAAFKPKMAPAKHPDDKTYIPLGRAEGNPSSTPAPLNIFFRAGSGLGSAASSLSGWFNNRMIPQALRPASSTTPAPQPQPQVIHIISNQQIKRKVVPSPEKKKKPQKNRQPLPVLEDSNDFHVVSTEMKRKPQKNRQPQLVFEDSDDSEDIEENDDSEDDINNEDGDTFNFNQDFIEDDDAEEDDYDQDEKRKGVRQSHQKQPERQYFYIEEEMNQDEDFDYDVQLPVRQPQRMQQQQQIYPNRRRKNSKQQQKRRKPVKKGQMAQNRPSQVKRKQRPAASFELVPISQNQAINSIQKKKNPNSPAQNNNQQRPVTQFFNIPWSRLGLTGPPKETASNEQQSKPIIIQIPSPQKVKRKRRPNKKPVNSVKKSQRKPMRGQLQSQAPVFAMLSEQQIREFFNNPANQQSSVVLSEMSNLPVTLNKKKKPVKKESEDMPSEDNNNKNDESEPEEKPQAEMEGQNDEEENSYIYVGPANDDKEIDLDLYRHHKGRSAPRHRHSWEEDLEDDDDDYDEE